MSATSIRQFAPAAAKRPTALLVTLVGGLFALPLLYAVIAYLISPGQLRYTVDSAYITIYTTGGFTGDVKKIALGRVDDLATAWLRGGEMQYGTKKGGYCVGFFRYPSLGEVWQATDCSNDGVIIRAGGEIHPVVITPADREGFLAAAKEARVGTFLAPTKPSGIPWGTLAVIIACLWPPAALAFGALFLAPRRLSYHVGNGALEVRTIFSRTSVPLAGLKARIHQPLQGARLAGIGVPGYHVGVFELDQAATAVYGTTRDRGVLLEADERVLVTPMDEAGFLAAVGAAGATVKS